MANREENLKKINAELEKLTDEQLDAVAGGRGGRRVSIYDFIMEKSREAQEILKTIPENERQDPDKLARKIVEKVIRK